MSDDILRALVTKVDSLDNKVEKAILKLDNILTKLELTHNSLVGESREQDNKMKSVMSAIGELKVSGKPSPSKKEAATTAADGTKKKEVTINNSFKTMFVTDPKKAMEVFAVGKDIVEKVENSAVVMQMSDETKKKKKIAGEVWTLAFNTADKKQAAKDRYKDYLAKNGLSAGVSEKVEVKTDIPVLATIMSGMNSMIDTSIPSAGGVVITPPSLQAIGTPTLTLT